ncbi:MAG: chromosome segregation protein SMC, partial [Ignavibacteria bacterium]
MYLNKLEIIGFKSFAEKIGIEFDSGMTAIVGPNGCGKTNIVDAVRWVIGEQKASVLRSSTMENVIFNGTKNRKALGYAEVSLTIENTKGILPSEYSEITITRRCFRDGQSNYLLNGTSCRLKDITALFMDTGMGADAYSVIELKMVNEILSHRTQDRRKLFEEAAGITKYKERRRETLYKLEIARESLNEATIEIRNRQRTVNAYERIARQRQEANEISEKLKSMEIDYHQRYMSKLIEDTEQIESGLKLKEEHREAVQSKLNENENIIDKYKNELNKTEKTLNETRDTLNNINSKINEVQNSISISEQRIKYLKETIERFRKERAELENEISILESSKSELEERITVINETIKLTEESLSAKRAALDEIELKVKSSKDELKDLTVKHAAISRTVLEKRNEYEITKNRLEDQLSRCSKLTDENIKNINKISVLDKETEALETELGDYKNNLSKLTLKYDELKRTRDNYSEEIIRLEKDIIYKSQEAEKIKVKVSFQINLLENYEDYSEGVKYLVKERNERDVKVVIEKLEVEDKFKIAIEAALGEVSNYLIVNDAEAAQKFIDILKEKQKGKITFILKNNLYNTELNIFQDEFPEILKHEGVYGWADKFIKCPEEYLLLYKYLLDEYIIVENLDTAKKLSQGNFIKFITLDGDIVTNSFLRAGSRTNIETIKIGREKLISNFKDNIKELELELERDNLHLSEAKNKFSEIDLDTLSDKVQELKSKILECENKISQLKYLKTQTNTLAENYNSENEMLSASNKELSEKLDKLILEIEEAENLKYQREKELEHFTTELETLADELTSKRDEYNNFNIEETRVKGELTNLQNEMARTVEGIGSKRSTIEGRSIESAKYEIEIQVLHSEIEPTENEGRGSGLKQQLSLLEAEKNEIEKDFNLVKSEYDAKRSIVDKIEQEQRLVRNERDETINYIHQSEMQLTKDRIEIKEHKDRILEEYNESIVYTAYEDAGSYDFTSCKLEIDKLRMRLRQLGGTGQMELGIYEQEKNELEKLIEEKNDLIKAEEDLI